MIQSRENQMTESSNTARRPVALVTGAAGGIGLEACRCLGRDGFAVLAADLSAMPDDAPDHVYRALDVRSEDSIREAFEAAEALGDLRAVVVSHGIGAVTDVESAGKAEILPVTDINLMGVALVALEAGRRMASGSAVVIVSSIVSTAGRGKNSFMYAATKGGVDAMMRNLAVNFGPRGVRFNAVAPGFLSRPMAGIGAELRARQGGNQAFMPFSPMGRLPTPAEVGEAIAFLCSARASGISGAVLAVDAAQGAF